MKAVVEKSSQRAFFRILQQKVATRHRSKESILYCKSPIQIESTLLKLFRHNKWFCYLACSSMKILMI